MAAGVRSATPRRAFVRPRSHNFCTSPHRGDMLDLRTLLAVAVLFGCVGTAPARDYPVTITAARVGLPLVDGSTIHITRFACWSPVYIDLEITVAIHELAEL